MSNEWFCLRSVAVKFVHLISIGARFPATLKYLSYAPTPLAYVVFFQRLHTWDQAWILDHERHQLGGVTSDFEEFQAIFLHEILKRSVRSQADVVTMVLLQLLTKCEEWLNIPPRSDNVYDNIERWWTFAMDIWRPGGRCDKLPSISSQLISLNVLSNPCIGLADRYVDASVT